MGFALRHHVYGCIANERVAFLDLMANRYFSAPPMMEKVIKTLVGDTPTGVANIEPLRSLLSRGLIIEIDGPGLSLTHITLPKPVASVFDSEVGGRSAAQLTRSLSTRLASATSLKIRPAHKVIDQIAERKSSAVNTGEAFSKAEISDMASSFIVSRRIISKQDKCLPWSVSMVNYLSRFHFFPDLVIGVKMNPFAAHAWVQHCDVVLSDTVESVRPYTPIMTV